MNQDYERNLMANGDNAMLFCTECYSKLAIEELIYDGVQFCSRECRNYYVNFLY